MLIASVHRVIVIQSDIPTRAIQVQREIVPIVVLNLFFSLMKQKTVCGSENQDLDWLIETQPKSLLVKD